MTKHLIDKPIENISHLIKTKQISPVELTIEVLNHVESTNQQINAYITIIRYSALKSAKKAENEILNNHYKGAYHGIPIAIKDNIYIKNEYTTMGSKIHERFIPKYNAEVVEKLQDAGAIIIGKLNMHEYAWGITNNNPHYGPSRNPWNREKITGGSSGGSGAAIAANMAFATLGTDTGGSVRIPASACGVVGLKPSYRRVSNAGSFPLAPTLDHIGPMGKTVNDVANLLKLIEVNNNYFKEKYSVKLVDDFNLKNLVIGIHEGFFYSNVDKGIVKHIKKNIKIYEDYGAKVKKVDIPSINEVRWAQSVILQSEFANVHRNNRINRLSDYGEDIQEQFKLKLPSVIDYIEALDIRKKLQEETKYLFEDIDVLISPTLSIMPPKIGDRITRIEGREVDIFTSILRLTGFANLTGLPAISLPCGIQENMPVGIQIIGPYYEDEFILRVASFLEKHNNLLNTDLSSLKKTKLR